MADVLTPQADGQSSFYTSPRQRTPSPPTTTILMGGAGRHDFKSKPLAAPAPPQQSLLRSYASTPSLSSRDSSSDLSNLLSSTSPPSSVTSSLEEKYAQEPDFEDSFPQYDSFGQRPNEGNDDHAETISTASDSPLPTPTVADDTAIRHEPSQHVDYLSHNWREEDVWSSWRHIVSQRKTYGQQSRLENAAWRTWIKNKYQLRTVSPETLNWLKESDVTWLYGPLTPAQTRPITQSDSAPESNLSKSNSFLHKKPILKKRSMSEVMLQKSLSTSSLLKQAAASVQAQGRNTRRPILGRAVSDFIGSGIVSESSSRAGNDSLASTGSSGTQTPSECREKRHIRFDDTVEQCIAVDIKPEEEEDDDESDDSDEEGRTYRTSISSDSSDEGVVMMKRTRRPGLSTRHSSGKLSRTNSLSGRKMVETLPSTTLKYRTDSPEVSEEQHQAGLSKAWKAGRLSPSPSQETIRPPRPSRNFLIGEDEDADDDDTNASSWIFGSNNPRSSLGAMPDSSATGRRDPPSAVPHSRSGASYGGSRTSLDDQNDQRQLLGLQSEPGAYGMEGMRRTESGMFVPYEEDEDDAMARGLFGRISETVNTARDIAHVIWNVGWRK